MKKKGKKGSMSDPEEGVMHKKMPRKKMKK